MNIKLIDGSELTVEFKEFKTRKVDRDYQMALSEGVLIDGAGNAQFPASNVQKANDILVIGMTNLSKEQLDNISSGDYNKILDKINSENEKKR